MTVTTSYDVDPVQTPVPVPAAGYTAEQTEVTALANGGYAVVVVDSGGYADLSIYDGTGAVVNSNNGFRATDVKITTLANGNILVIGDVDNTLDYRIFSPTGAVVDAENINRATGIENASVTATTGNGFAAVFQYNLSATDSDLYVDINGTAIPLDTSSNTLDENASIAHLNDGGFAIAWDRKAGDGSTSLYYEVLNADGGIRSAEALKDVQGTDNQQPNVVALQNGGFAVTYEDNGWDGPQSDITQADFAANGNFVQYYRISTSTSPDNQAASAVLSDGTVATVFTNAYSSTDTDIEASFFDEASGGFFATNLELAATTDLEGQPSIAALGNNKFAVSYIDATTGDAEVGLYQMVRSITGDNADNVLAGDAQSDSISGAGGNDIIYPGGVADNQVDGGAGYDTAVFTGARADYTISRTNGATTITGADGGRTTLTTVEELSFSDQNVFTPPMVRDLDGTGFSDIVLQNTDGTIRAWFLNSDGSLFSSAKTSKTPSSAWHVTATGQFNLAADSYDDLLLQNTNGNLQVWEMNGSTVNSIVNIGALNTGWSAVTTGDFNGDGQADIVVENSTTVRIWAMNGTTATSKVDISTAGYQVIDTGDFNGDGKSDLLVEKSSQLYIWLMNGTTRTESDKVGAALTAGWQAVSSGDFNGDGKSDILLWNSTTGAVMVKELNGASVIASATVGTIGLAYHATGTADINGDGKSDIIFQNSSGRVQEWLMSGTTILSQATINSPGTGWSLAAGTGG